MTGPILLLLAALIGATSGQGSCDCRPCKEMEDGTYLLTEDKGESYAKCGATGEGNLAGCLYRRQTDDQEFCLCDSKPAESQKSEKTSYTSCDEEQTCPTEQPKFGSPCSLPPSLQCSYGKECCCGQCHPSMEFTCAGNRWTGLFTEACMRPACGDGVNTVDKKTSVCICTCLCWIKTVCSAQLLCIEAGTAF